MHTPNYPKVQHRFESDFLREATLGASDRERYAELLIELEAFEKTEEAKSIRSSCSPVLVFNQTRQLILANASALELVHAERNDDVIGLRLGELLGCNHKMGEAKKGEEYHCHNCNCMPSMVSALAGTEASEEKILTMNAEEDAKRANYKVSCKPLSLAEKPYAVMTLSAI